MVYQLWKFSLQNFLMSPYKQGRRPRNHGNSLSFPLYLFQDLKSLQICVVLVRETSNNKNPVMIQLISHDITLETMTHNM